MTDSAGEEAARALLRTALGVEPLELRRQSLTESGNTIYRADLANGESVALRISPRATAFAYTARNLSALRALGLPVPACRATGPAAAGSFIVLEWLPGEDLAAALPRLGAAELTRIATSVVEWQRRVSSLPVSRGFGWAPIGCDAPARSWSEIFGAPVPEGQAPPPGTPDDALRQRLRRVRRTLEDYFASVRPLCFLDDLTTRNLLIADGAVSGVIDVDHVCYGDPLLSLGTTLALLAEAAAKADPRGDAIHAAEGGHYGGALLGRWNPAGDALRAVWFYASLWSASALTRAEASGAWPAAAMLRAVLEIMLRRATGRPHRPAATTAAAVG